MAFNWDKHRFSGGALVFDLVNTVVRRLDPLRRKDRLSDFMATTRFANAALVFRREETRLHTGGHVIDRAENILLLELREAAYTFFRPQTERVRAGHADLAKLISLIARALSLSSVMPFAGDVALSALNHVNFHKHMRLKACPNCDWLFLDKSKNGSRIWCDMAVCGNRQKARRNYRKRSNQMTMAEAGP